VKTASMITVLIAWSIAAAALIGLPGSQGIAAADPKVSGAPRGHQHNHEGLTWPPQVRGSTNAVVHSNVEQEKIGRALKGARMDRLERKAKTHTEANRALGNRSTRITVIDREDKTTGQKATQMVFFSRDKNATVEVDFDNEQIQAVRSIPAWEYQPEITNEEATEAAGLARTYFLSQGFAKAGSMKAFSILPYKPEGIGYFDTRVLYVSFHQHDDANPEFAAWVDLTNQLILKTRVEQ
jgi:hypothetical protein